jgi:hypothetical protein
MIDLVIFAQFTVSHSELCNLEKLLIMQSPPAVWRLFVIGCGFSFHDLFAADTVIRSLLIFGSIVSVRDLFSTSLLRRGCAGNVQSPVPLMKLQESWNDFSGPGVPFVDGFQRVRGAFSISTLEAV